MYESDDAISTLYMQPMIIEDTPGEETISHSRYILDISKVTEDWFTINEAPQGYDPFTE